MKTDLEILLVEDDADTRANLCDILELDGHRVVGVGSISEARKQASERPYCIVILDRKLPDGTAEEFLPELKSILSETHVIVVTGYADMDSTVAAFRSGAADYILKPINPDALRNSVARISYQRQTQLELQKEQEFADQILATAEAIVLVLDLHGTVVRFNPFFERISGWTLQELAGRDWFLACIPDRERERVRRVFLQTANDLHTSGTINPILTSDGLERQIRWSNTTLKDERGEPSAVLAVGVDITEHLLAQQRATRSERLATIGATMAALAHESRNALQRIQAGIEMLELDLADQPDSLNELATIQRATKDLNELLEELRSYAAPIRLQLGQGNIHDHYQRAWRNLQESRQGRDADLIAVSDKNEFFCRADPMRMEQVFRNLFENALAACDDPVRVQVACRRDDEDWIEIRVSDNGPGLTAEQAAKAFEPFFTTKSRGTGLGLPISRRIVEAHQGTIESVADNKSQSGAEFLIRIPVQPDVQNYEG